MSMKNLHIGLGSKTPKASCKMLNALAERKQAEDQSM